jgi:hypothetical protein
MSAFSAPMEKIGRGAALEKKSMHLQIEQVSDSRGDSSPKADIYDSNTSMTDFTSYGAFQQLKSVDKGLSVLSHNDGFQDRKVSLTNISELDSTENGHVFDQR